MLKTIFFDLPRNLKQNKHIIFTIFSLNITIIQFLIYPLLTFKLNSLYGYEKYAALMTHQLLVLKKGLHIVYVHTNMAQEENR